jgi:membrane protease YdiL (CAAX protease family)
MGFGGTFSWPGFLYIIITVLLTLIFTKLVSNRIDLSNLQLTIKYPGVSNNWLIENSIVWGLYLFSYELLLRGFLLFSSLALFGFVYSIIINCLVYSIIHIPKGRAEALGAIPFGIILCLITLQTKSIWGAYILHMSLAVSMDWKIVKRINKAVELNL